MREVLRLFEDHSRNRPDAPALEEEDSRWSFAELDAASTNLAHRMVEAGATGNATVTWIGGAGAARIIAFLASQKAGPAFSSPILQMGAPFVRDFLELVEPALVICEPGFETYLDGVQRPTITYVDDRAAGAPQFAPVDEDWISHLSFTSGSTGLPKGMPRSRAAMGYFVLKAIDMLRVTPADHYGLLGNFWNPTLFVGLAAGAPSYCFDTPRRGAAELTDWLADKRISAIMTYPAIFREVAASGKTLPDLRDTLLIGEPLTRRDAEAHAQLTRPDARLANVYGSMEFAYVTRFVRQASDPIDFDMMPMGVAADTDILRLVDEDGVDVPLGATGEVQIVSDHVVQGYLGDPERSAEKFGRLEDGRKYQVTGDLAYQDHRGVFHSVGRRDGQTKVRGYNVRPPEIEIIIREFPHVDEVAVIVREGPVGIARLVCYFTGAAEVDDLRTAVKARLPNYMVPSVWMRMDALPKTTAGKIKRVALPDPFASEGEAPVSGASPEERRIETIFREVLGLSSIGRHDDFFDLGGDSLQAMRVLLEIETAFGVRIPFESFILDGASIAYLNTRLRSGESGGPSVVRPGTGGPTLLLMPGFDGFSAAFMPMVDRLDQKFRVVSGNCDISKTTSIEEMASAMLEQMRPEMEAGGEIILMGYSLGGIIAGQVAAAAEKSGFEAPSLALFDPQIQWRGVIGDFVDAGRAAARGKLRRARAHLGGAAHRLGLRPTSDEDERRRVMIMRHRPRRVPAKRTFYVSCDDPAALENAAAWSRVLSGPCEITTTEAAHHFILQEPHVAPLTQAFQAWLERG